MKIVAFSSDKRFGIFAECFKKDAIEIGLLVTQSPKTQGRSHEIKPNEAHLFALKNNIPVLHPEQLDAVFSKDLSKYDTDLGFIFAYGKIIPDMIINQFSKGIFNIHFSLLPQYIGPSPIQQALLDNISETGYTVFKITSKLDSGDVLIQEKINIKPDDNFDSLRERIIESSLQILSAQLKKYSDGFSKLEPMETINSSYTKKITKDDGLISEEDTARTAYNKIRAFSHWPKTFVKIDGKRYIIHDASINNKTLDIKQIQPEGKKIMSFMDFKKGYYSLLTKFPDFVNIS
jgi:methionyl-tRNA formyltransferase